MTFHPDPVLTMVASAFFSLLFGTAATHKLIAWRLFQQQLGDYRVLPLAWTTVAAVIVPAGEALLALGWLNDGTRPAAAILSAALLAVYGAAMAWNLNEGRDTIDCGCGGADGAQVIRPALVVRNLLLACVSVALALLLPPAQQDMRAIGWIDWISVVAGALALLGMYATTNQLLANLPPQRVLD
jgi:hypothetical protein